MKLVWVVSGFFTGILLRSFVDFGWAMPGLILLLGLACLCLRFIFEREQIYILFVIFFFAASVGMARFEWNDAKRDIVPIGTTALVVDEPDERENSVRYIAKIGESRVLIVSRLSPKFKYGDRLSVLGKFERVGDAYLNKDGVYYQVLFPKLSLVGEGDGNWLRAKLFAVKNWFSANIARLIAEPENALAGGLVLGAKQSLGKDLLDDFRNAGLIHMVVLSGYNITIVALSMMWFFGKFLSKRVSIIAGVISILLFAVMVGGGATVFRASIMAILALLAQATGRTSEISRALVLAALLMVFINPKLLVFDIGFQLSFLATLGLIYLEPIIRPYFIRLPEKILWMDFRKIASATIAAQLAVLPLILYTFGNFSLYAFPVNMLVLPIVPTSMLLVFLTGILFPIPIISLIAYPISWLAYALLGYIISIVRLVSSLPFASLTFSSVPLALIIVMYIVIIYVVSLNHKKEQHLGVGPPSA